VVRWVLVAFLLLRIPEIVVIGLGHEIYGGKASADSHAETVVARDPSGD
jgi:hypothetical protein